MKHYVTAATRKPLQPRVRPLDLIFNPQRIAVIGASEEPNSVGRALLENLDQKVFRVFVVNPNRPTILGLKTYPDIGSVPEPVDLALIATPARTVPKIVGQCVEAGIKSSIILSAGFKERGPEGLALEQQIAALARGKMRIVGPNCFGVIVPHTGLNATFANVIPRPGNVAFISQSGAFCSAILDWSLHEKVGFSAFVSIGSMLDVGWGDLIYHFGDDPRTKSIVIYMESIGDARSFLSAAREVALTKPVIVLKVGRTEAASKAAASHTGSMTGSDEVLTAAFRRVGVVRVNTIEELFNMAGVLSKQPRPQGPRLAIVTNAGGPGAVATDMLAGHGGELSPLSQPTLNAFDSFLPPHWSHANPIDILGDADPQRYAKALQLVRDDPTVDGALVILTPQTMTDPSGTAAQVAAMADFGGKPLLACWMGGDSVAAGKDILNAASISTFDYPDVAARAFQYMVRYAYNLRAIYQTPSLGTLSGEREMARQQAEALIQAGRAAGRTLLTEYESKQILEAYGIPTAKTRVARSKEEAVEAARQLGYPVVVKLCSETITHKSDVGGVQINLKNSQAVKRAWDAIEQNVTTKAGRQHFLGVTVEPMITVEGYELILGSTLDSQFGPVLLFGLGGQLVEVFKDRALALPPLTSTLARRLMEQTRIYSALQGVRGRKPVDLAALEQLLVRFSYLVAEQRWIREIDINPLLASPGQLIALDARIVLHGPEVKEEDLPKLAIRPYPPQYISEWKTKEGLPVTIRPIRPEDEPLIIQFHENLSEQSVYLCNFMPLNFKQRIAHERLTRICFNDYDREIALVADYYNEKRGRHEILGVTRLRKLHDVNEAEFGMVIADAWQSLGLGTELLTQLIQIARNEKLSRIFTTVLQENHQMEKICLNLGFELTRVAEKSEYNAQLLL